MNLERLIRDAASDTPDPQRALKGLERMLDTSPDFLEAESENIPLMAKLFGRSRFLTDLSVRRPDVLSSALKNMESPVTSGLVVGLADWDMLKSSREDAMKALRDMKKRLLLIITLRDISGRTGLYETMSELSVLAEGLTGIALESARHFVNERFGGLEDDYFSVIALGKLGAGELNYSSDIDILCVYRTGEGATSGVLSDSGVSLNRIDVREYYARLTETLSQLLNKQTEDGIAYRVDLRLRPNGQKGEIALSLDSYKSYYESWGKTWERMALIRARPVAGDPDLGEAFIQAIEPFVWKRSVGYEDIEEIRELKRKIDALYDIDDIKRGYGGIREIEFFVQTFQLVYGSEDKDLRTGSLERALKSLTKRGLIPQEDASALEEGYVFLRKVEHLLQMLDDTQTHTLPKDADELEALGRKMGYSGLDAFSPHLKLQRLKVRDMYNNLLGRDSTREDEGALVFDGGLRDDALLEFLKFKRFSDPEGALMNLKAIREQSSFEKTITARNALRKTVSICVSRVLSSPNPDRALGMLSAFIEKVGDHESYVLMLAKRQDTIEAIVSAFTRSAYLTRLIFGLGNLEGIFEYPDLRLNFRALRERLVETLSRSQRPENSLRDFKAMEELKAGLLFLNRHIPIEALSNMLTLLAVNVLRASMTHLGSKDRLGIIGLGRLGAREINMASDLDLIFIGEGAAADEAAGFIKFLSEYTEKGVAYDIDTRLRPDGEKGPLVNNIQGLREYYLKHAGNWEVQALLRAKPVAGNWGLLSGFSALRTEAVLKRGADMTTEELLSMREKIIKERSKEDEGMDVKLGPGGAGEIEFLVQFLQLKNARRHPSVIARNTGIALRKIADAGIMTHAEADALLEAHSFMRTVEAFLRLNDEFVLAPDAPVTLLAASFMKLADGADELISKAESRRHKVLGIARRHYGG